MSNPFRRITLNLSCTVPCYAVQQIFFSASPRGSVQLSKLSIGTKLVVKMVFCTIIVVIMSNPIRRITLNLPCTVPCYAVQQIFFLPLQAIKTVNRNKVSCEMVFCTIIVVIMSNPFQRITLNLSFTVPCYSVQQIYFLPLQGETSSYQNYQLERNKL